MLMMMIIIFIVMLKALFCECVGEKYKKKHCGLSKVVNIINIHIVYSLHKYKLKNTFTGENMYWNEYYILVFISYFIFKALHKFQIHTN
jgi:hypothetical protein